MKKFFFVILALIACVPESFAQQRENHSSQVAKNLEIFEEIYKDLDLYYVDTIPADTALRWAIDGMLMRVDPFTAYFPADDEDLRQMSTGKYAGIGAIIRFSKKQNRVVVDEPYDGTPSYNAGLQAGDILISIDGKDVKGLPSAKVTSMLRGEPGTTFSLVYQRPGQTKKTTVRITRATIQIPSVPYYGMIGNNTGYITLTGFTEGSAREVRGALEELQRQGAKSLVLDLRDNPGGSLSEAVDIANLFIPKGQKVVYTQGKVAAANREYLTTTDPIAPDIPIVVLVNSGTASAAEIVSGTLQDLDRAVVVGSKTYGKGLVQAVRDLPYRGELKLTTSKYYIPSGRCIQAHTYNHDGTTVTLPDSLTHVFHTAKGREVRDGGGINPDIKSEPDSVATMIYDLVQSEPYQDWITEYHQKHSTIAPAGEFHLTDAEYDDFSKYIQKSDFTYNRRSLELIKLLRDVAKREGYLETTEPEMKALEDKFATNLKADLERNKKDILPLLETEIVSRYYLLRGAIQQQLLNDKVLHRALEIIQNDKEYSKILK